MPTVMRELPDGYISGKLLDRSQHSEVYEAVRESDGAPVFLKSYFTDRVSDPHPRAAHEFAVMRRVESRGVPRALALDRSTPRPILVLERVTGATLEHLLTEGPLSLERWLDVGVALAETLAQIHAARLLHNDLRPTNIRVDEGSSTISILGFDLATEIGVDQRNTAGHTVHSTLLYVAPEQTGRMNRGCDVRSDLYSLGATLYHALVGRPPFESNDRLELIHAHMAHIPTSPQDRRPDAPDTLSRLILKLLKKEPAERYQSANALHSDLLACRQQWLESGAIDDDFPLGTAETPAGPSFPSRLYGRERELEKILQLHALTASGEIRSLWLQGDAGSGKSALVDALRPRLAQSGAYLATGKFAPYRDRPYDGWVTALGSLVQQLLLESNVHLERWRRELQAGLGNIAGALLALAPDLAFILDDAPAIPSLGPAETRARLSLALQRFVRVCAAREHPLVILLDDLQWTDAGSLGLLEDLLSGAEPGALLVIGACRASEVGSEHPLARMLERIVRRRVPVETLRLDPLPIRTAETLLADALERQPDEIATLAAIIERKTGNNPGLMRQFVEYIHAQGLLHYRNGRGWSWNPARIAAADIPDGAVALMTEKIGRLEPGARKLIEFASCVGDEFDADVLVELGHVERDTVETGLYALADAGLIAPCASGFRFAHGRIREAAQSLLSSDALARAHSEIAQLLLARMPETERNHQVFSIVEHLNCGLKHLPAELRVTTIQLDLLAGKRALEGGAASTAERYFAVARELLQEEDWIHEHASIFDLLLCSAESALLVREFERAVALLDELDRRAASRLESIQVAIKRTRVLALTRDADECTRYALDALKQFGVRWPLRPPAWRAALAVRALQWRIWFHGEEALLRPAEDARPELEALIQLIRIAGGVMARVNFHLGVLASCWVTSSMLRHGYMANPAYTLAVYAGSLQILLLDSSRAQHLVDLALRWNEVDPDPVYGPRTELQVRIILLPWWMRRRQALAPLATAGEKMREVGDLEYAYYADFSSNVYRALAGENVSTAHRAFSELAETIQRRGHHFPASACCARTLGLLMHPCASLEGELEQNDAWIVANRLTAEPYIRTLWLMLLCVHGRHDLAFAQSEQLGKRLFKVVPYVHVADHMLYRGLAAASLARKALGAPRHGYARKLRTCLASLRRWALSGPDFVHMARFLEAERANLRGRSADARDLYLQAAEMAQQQDFIHHAALAHEHRARMLLRQRRETEGVAALREALPLYTSWGALAKVEALTQECRTLAGSRVE